ncbi:MAG: protein kinase [Bryobacterales bacterium]|nr:protein kinase [Bryobacterales bacterium]
MNAQRWAQAKDILYAALELSGEARHAYLAEACADDAELRAEVSSLIEAHEGNSLIRTMGWDVEQPDLLPKGTRLGSYVIVEEIGQGGMGAVYLALRDDGLYQQQVAIKVVKRGMDSDAILRRFHYERQILAFLNHPYIARMLDGGTTEDGRPYLVMEYVAGKPIIEYSQQQKLNLHARLALFKQVCEAVAYAHRQLIVHRDLKPANILVTEDGTPRLLDFGVATLMLPDTQDAVEVTQTVSQRLLTPAYASPEQFRGERVTTTSDVYSLGTILYELLTGAKAHQLKDSSYDELYRVICEREPVRPSAALEVRPIGFVSHGELRGDLDRVIGKAMHKEGSRRYASVEQFCEDIDRHLKNLPVRARDDSAAYRASKFVARHKATVAAATVAAISLMAGVVGTAWQARTARIERDRAERRFRDVRRLATTFLIDNDTLGALDGGTELRRRLIERSLEYLDGLAHEAADDVSLQRELALAYEKLGDVQGRQDGPNLGDTVAALGSYRKAMAIREIAARTNPGDSAIQLELARSRERLSGALKIAGSFGDAIILDRQAVAIRERLAAENPKNLEYKRQLASGYTNLGGTLSQLGEWPAVIETRRKALKLWEELVETGKAPEDWRGLVLAHTRMASIYHHEKKMKESLDHYKTAVSTANRAVAQFPKHGALQTVQGGALMGLGTYYKDVNQNAEALRNFEKSQAIFAAHHAADPKDLRAISLLGTTHYRIGTVLRSTGQRDAARKELMRSLELRQEVANRNRLNAGAKGEVAESQAALGELAAASGRYAEARDWYGKAQTVLATLKSEGRLNAVSIDDLAKIEQALAKLPK